MWMASILQVLALGAVDPAAPLAASAAPAPIYWRQSLFSIPFHLDRPDRATPVPAEVQLYVSPDRGVHWDNWRQAPPEKGFFLFKAGNDGEYWFDVRTLDRSGQIRPQGPHTPKLIVIVDTVPPKAQLTARRGNAGQITAAFRIEELYPNLDSLAIEYRFSPTAAWQTVPVGPKTSAATTPNIQARSPGIHKVPREPRRFAFASTTWPAIRRNVTRKSFFRRERQQREVPCGHPWNLERQLRPQLRLPPQQRFLRPELPPSLPIRGNRLAPERAERLGRQKTPVRLPARQSR